MGLIADLMQGYDKNDLADAEIIIKKLKFGKTMVLIKPRQFFTIAKKKNL